MPMITDWLMVGITAVYVVATIMICWANINSAKATREQIAESRRQFEEENRAFVTVNFEIIRNGLAVLHIQNLGKQVAKDLRICIGESFIENLPDKDGREYLKKLSNSTTMLGIGQSWYVFFGTSYQAEQMGKEKIEAELSYSDSKADYNEHIVIDLSQYLWALVYDSPEEDLHQEIKKMAAHISSIDGTLKKLQIVESKSKERPPMSDQSSSIISITKPTGGDIT